MSNEYKNPDSSEKNVPFSPGFRLQTYVSDGAFVSVRDFQQQTADSISKCSVFYVRDKPMGRARCRPYFFLHI